MFISALTTSIHNPSMLVEEMNQRDDNNPISRFPVSLPDFPYGHKIQLDLAIFSGLLSDRTT
jgi:hypothetical protein